MSFKIASKQIFALIGVTIVGFLLIQLIPVNTTNPPVVQEPMWDSAQTRDLTQRACFDCHSNQTQWPSYAHIAPISWVMANHVSEGRQTLNFSNWSSARGAENEVIEVIKEGSMPPLYYTLTHPQARLTSAETISLIRGLEATFNNSRASNFSALVAGKMASASQ